MEPEFLFPIGAVCIGCACGVVLKRAGWGLVVLVITALCVAVSYVLLFHSQLLGWEGMGPGMVVVIGVAPFGIGVLVGAVAHVLYSVWHKSGSD
ncbi:hypothetical protein K3727_14860 [Rhodobacteraceae bacterium M382]|nr:hypothetical protein K3727_14860 [Rhodobacteraceae bacterium M382]